MTSQHSPTPRTRWRSGRRHAPWLVTLSLHGAVLATIAHCGDRPAVRQSAAPVEIEYLAARARRPDSQTPLDTPVQPMAGPARDLTAPREAPARVRPTRSPASTRSRQANQQFPDPPAAAEVPGPDDGAVPAHTGALASLDMPITGSTGLLAAPAAGSSGAGQGASGQGVSGQGAGAPKIRGSIQKLADIRPGVTRTKARPPRLVYPRRDGPERAGQVFVVVLMIDKDGYVDGVRLKQGVSRHRDEKALDAVWRFRYDPARDDAGRPIAAQIVQRFMVE